ncbi:MAG: Mrp/NBP35 family ATP-binding protein [Halanaerobiales bacterium]
MYEVKDKKVELKNGSINEGLVAVASGKGGVGKSTVTVNLATALVKEGKKVGIIDADIHGFSVPRILGLKEQPRAISEKEIIPPEKEGIKVMSMGSFVDEDKAVIWRAPLLLGALQQFMEDVQWGELDYLLLDLPPGTGDMPLNIMQNLPHASMLLVTTPQITATSVAGRVGKLAEKLNIDILGLIENMSYFECSDCGNKEYIFGKGGGKELADRLGIDLLAELPLLAGIRESSDQGEPIIFSDPDNTIARSYLDIARKIISNHKDFDPDIKPINLQK